MRLLAISSLEEAARRSVRAYWQVAEILTAFLRQSSCRGAEEDSAREGWAAPTLPPDFQTALTVLARWGPTGERDEAAEERSLNLSGAGLSCASLPGARLAGANLRDSCLMSAELWKANLKHADLSGAHLEGTNMSGAVLDSAKLNKASLNGANLEYASLQGADLSEADLTGTNLTLAHLEGANLSEVSGLTKVQVESAYMDAGTKLPETLA